MDLDWWAIQTVVRMTHHWDNVPVKGVHRRGGEWIKQTLYVGKFESTTVVYVGNLPVVVPLLTSSTIPIDLHVGPGRSFLPVS